MTVVDRRADPRTDASLSGALAPALARAATVAGPRPLTWTSLPIARVDPIDLFAAARALDLEAALWLQPAAGRSIVGIGRAWAIEPDRDGRVDMAAGAWREAMQAAVGDTDATAGPTLLGGLGFTGRRPAMEDPWGRFGAASLVLPTFVVTQGVDGPAS